MAGPRRDALERVVEAALLPGAFVGDDASWGFVRDLEAVREEIRRAIDEPVQARGLLGSIPAVREEIRRAIDEPGDEARRAVALLELFLAWVERGLALTAQRRSWGDGSAWQLPRLQREILKTLGRGGEALASAWELHAAMAIRILDARKSAYYGAALQNLENARKLLLREGRAAEWRALADELRSAHRRKTSFLPGFDRIEAGRSAREPSFRERARRRWRLQSGAGGRMRS